MDIFKSVRSLLKKRALSAGDIEWELYQRNRLSGMDASYPTYFTSESGNYLIYVDRGKLYRVSASVSGGSLTLGDAEEIFVEHLPVSRSNIIVERTEEGLRFAAIAGASTINRSHEIDSTSLFDSLIEEFREDETYRINFYHEIEDERYQMGEVVHLERVGNLLLAYGIIDENTVFGREAARNFSEKEDLWGLSIEFVPFEYETLTSDGVEIRSYTKGKFHGLAVVLEKDAAHYFTKIVS